MTNEELIASSEEMLNTLTTSLGKLKMASRALKNLETGKLKVKVVNNDVTEDLTVLLFDLDNPENFLRKTIINRLTAICKDAEARLNSFQVLANNANERVTKEQIEKKEILVDTGVPVQRNRSYKSVDVISDEEFMDLYYNKHYKITEIAKMKGISKWTLYQRKDKLDAVRKKEKEISEVARAEGAESIVFTSAVVNGNEQSANTSSESANTSSESAVPSPAPLPPVEEEQKGPTDKELQKMYYTSCMTPSEISEKTGLHLTEVLTRLEKIQLELKEAEKECATSRQAET